MQTRPFLSSVPAGIPLNGVSAVTPTAPVVPFCREGREAAGQIPPLTPANCGENGIPWEFLGYKGNPRKTKDFSGHQGGARVLPCLACPSPPVDIRRNKPGTPPYVRPSMVNSSLT